MLLEHCEEKTRGVVGWVFGLGWGGGGGGVLGGGGGFVIVFWLFFWFLGGGDHRSDPIL